MLAWLAACIAGRRRRSSCGGNRNHMQETDVGLNRKHISFFFKLLLFLADYRHMLMFVHSDVWVAILQPTGYRFDRASGATVKETIKLASPRQQFFYNTNYEIRVAVRSPFGDQRSRS